MKKQKKKKYIHYNQVLRSTVNRIIVILKLESFILHANKRKSDHPGLLEMEDRAYHHSCLRADWTNLYDRQVEAASH